MSFFKGFASELLKLAAVEMGEGGGEWYTTEGEPDSDMSPLMHENHVPDDVTVQSDRREFFHNLLGRENTNNDGKAVVPGRLSKSHGTRR